jgi:hypothetical protein
VFINVIELEYCLFSLYIRPKYYSITHWKDEMIIIFKVRVERREVGAV